MEDVDQDNSDIPAGRLERRTFLKAAAVGGILLGARIAAAPGTTADRRAGKAAADDRKLADLVHRCGAELGEVRTIG